MDVFEAIEKRRTVRNLKGGISEEQLHRLLLAGVQAPSGSNVQPWEFILIENEAVISRIAELKYLQTLKMRIDEMVLDDPGKIEGICTQEVPLLSVERYAGQKENYFKSTVLAVCNRKGHGKGRKPWMNVENVASTWMCIQNISLAATAEGLGTQISIFREEHKDMVEELLAIPDDYELATILLIGEIDKQPHGRRNARPEFSWLHKDTFGDQD